MNSQVNEKQYPVRVIDAKLANRARALKVCKILCLVLLAFVVFVILAGVLSFWILGSQMQHYLSNASNNTLSLSPVDESEVCNIPPVPILPPDFETLHMYQAGWDKEGAPVWIVELGSYDLRGNLEKNETYADLLILLSKFVVRQVQCSILQASKRQSGHAQGHNVSQSWASLTDMGGFTMSQMMSVEVIEYMKKGTETWYPVFPYMKFSIGIEASWVARSLFTILAPVMGDAYGKLSLYGYEKDYIPAILERISRDQLPEKYGGFSNYTCRTQFCNEGALAKFLG